VSADEKFYDGMSYHQGSVWPLFTGWAALAEYRAGQPLAGYRMLMENANLTWAQDLGADTELLSGDFYVPFGRSTSHQLWSSAMVITPTLRGLFGISVDAQSKTITVNPRLPASWDHAEVRDLNLLGVNGLLGFKRRDNSWQVSLVADAEHEWHLRSDMPGSKLELSPQQLEISNQVKTPFEPSLWIPFPEVEVEQPASETGFLSDASSGSEHEVPVAGVRTERCRILHLDYGNHRATITVEGLAGSRASLKVFSRGKSFPTVRTAPVADLANIQETSTHACNSDLDCSWEPLRISFPAGDGWKTITVTLTW
jgi:hypothetical protein